MSLSPPWLRALVSVAICLVFPVVASPAVAAPQNPHVHQEINLAEGTELLGTEELSHVKRDGKETMIDLKAGYELMEGANSLVLPISHWTPEGAFGRIVWESKQPGRETEIEIKPEPLAGAYSLFDYSLEGETLDELEAEAESGSATTPNATVSSGRSYLDELTELVDCRGRAKMTAALKARLGKLKPTVHIDIGHREFILELRGRPEIVGELEGEGDAYCEPKELPNLRIPLPLHTPPLFLHIGPFAHAEAHGEAEASLVWNPEFAVGGQKVGGNDATPIYKIEMGEPKVRDVTGDAELDVHLGVSVGLSVLGIVGVHGTFGPHLHARFDFSSPGVACHKAEASAFTKLTGKANLFFRKWDLNLGEKESEPKVLWKKGLCPRLRERLRRSPLFSSSRAGET
jgi:hypothetical protein